MLYSRSCVIESKANHRRSAPDKISVDLGSPISNNTDLVNNAPFVGVVVLSQERCSEFFVCSGGSFCIPKSVWTLTLTTYTCVEQRPQSFASLRQTFRGQRTSPHHRFSLSIDAKHWSEPALPVDCCAFFSGTAFLILTNFRQSGTCNYFLENFRTNFTCGEREDDVCGPVCDLKLFGLERKIFCLLWKIYNETDNEVKVTNI